MTQFGIVELSPISANIYNGKTHGAIILDARSHKIKLQVKQSLNEVDFYVVSDDLGYKNKISGTLTSKVDLMSDDAAHLPRTLNGTASFALSKGTISGIDLLRKIKSAVKFAKISLDTFKLPDSEEKTTPYTSIKGTFTVKDGVLHNNDLQLKSDVLTVKGDGQADLNTKRLNFHIIATLLSNRHKDISKLQELLGGGFPMNIHGTFSQFVVAPEYGEIGKAVSKNFLEKQTGKIEKIEKATEKKLEEIFKKLKQ